MRILFLASRDWLDSRACGGDLCTTDFARDLAARGHDVTLVVSRYRGSAPREVRDGVQIVRLGGLFLLAFRAFLYYVRHRGRFDAVYEEGLASLRVPYLAPVYVRKPLIAMWYQTHSKIFGEQYPRPLAWALTRAERLLLRLHRGCTVLALSDERRQELLALGLSEGRVVVAPPLMRDMAAPVIVPGPREREQLIVWLGKVRRYKCPHHAVEALARIRERVPSARLVIAGRSDDQGYQRELTALARRLGIEHAVELRLGITDAEKWQLLSQARALVVTSPVEGFGIVIVEANRCGTPAIVTEGVPEDVAVDNVTALRALFADRQALADAFVRLLTDDSLFDRLSTASAAQACRFSSAQAGRSIEELFMEVGARAA